MRQTFFQGGTIRKASDAYPWAAYVLACDGGFMCFESVDDAEVWAAQL